PRPEAGARRARAREGADRSPHRQARLRPDGVRWATEEPGRRRGDAPGPRGGGGQVTRSQLALVGFGVVVAAIFAGQTVPALAPVSRDVLTDAVLLRLGAATQPLLPFL